MAPEAWNMDRHIPWTGPCAQTPPKMRNRTWARAQTSPHFRAIGSEGVANRPPRPPEARRLYLALTKPRPPSQPCVSAEPSGPSGEAAWSRLGRGGGVVSALPDRRGPPKAAAVRRGNGGARRRRGRHCTRQHLPGHGRRQGGCG
eukprot:scaffold27481_cov35-Phaeocystis_antarctica.AAC.1